MTLREGTNDKYELYGLFTFANETTKTWKVTFVYRKWIEYEILPKYQVIFNQKSLLALLLPIIT